MVIEDIFFDLAVIVLIAAIAGYIFRLLKQPLIPAYILTGLLIGPAGGQVFQMLGLNFIAGAIENITISNIEVVRVASEIGIAFLLFFVGLEIDFRKLKHVTAISTIGGAFQIIISFLLGYFIALALRFAENEAIYIGLILSFSSTMIVIKLLSDKNEIDTLHGRIVIGILLMQDALAILALSYLTSMNLLFTSVLSISLVKAVILASITFISMKFIFPFVFRFAAKNQELLFLVSLAVCFCYAVFANYLGFSVAIGAFLAGVALGSLEYNVEIISKVRSLKDFFATIFFISLGMGMVVFKTKWMWFVLLLFVGFTIIIKPLVIQLISALFGYTKRTGFLTAISLAQASEFSLIIVAQGMLLGHISQEFFSLTILLTIITIIFTSYSIQYENVLYNIFAKPLAFFDAISPSKTGLEYVPAKKKQPEVVLCGCDRVGFNIFKALDKLKKKLVVVDFNPEVIRDLVRMQVHCVYGDIGDVEIIDRLGLKDMKMVISTVPDLKDNLLLIRKTKTANKNAVVIATAFDSQDALKLYKENADYVILPHYLGGAHVSNLIGEFEDTNKVIKTKLSHIKELQHDHTRRNTRKHIKH
ncbi:cation:proton antiporter [Candidatus Woesearchaeota archaeon]|nr:cation:proton antiporter [Candidatus Woesearchaeota archaeon]